LFSPPENWIAAALVVVYTLSAIFVFYPEYFTIIYPLARDRLFAAQSTDPWHSSLLRQLRYGSAR